MKKIKEGISFILDGLVSLLVATLVYIIVNFISIAIALLIGGLISLVFIPFIFIAFCIPIAFNIGAGCIHNLHKHGSYFARSWTDIYPLFVMILFIIASYYSSHSHGVVGSVIYLFYTVVYLIFLAIKYYVLYDKGKKDIYKPGPPGLQTGCISKAKNQRGSELMMGKIKEVISFIFDRLFFLIIATTIYAFAGYGILLIAFLLEGFALGIFHYGIATAINIGLSYWHNLIKYDSGTAKSWTDLYPLFGMIALIIFHYYDRGNFIHSLDISDVITFYLHCIGIYLIFLAIKYSVLYYNEKKLNKTNKTDPPKM